MKIYVEHILPNYTNQLRIQWGVDDPDPVLLTGVTFDVQRSGSASGPWETRASGLSGIFYVDTFEDASDDSTEENLLNLSKQVWYKITAHLSNSVQLESPPKDNFGTLPTLFDNVQGVGLIPDAQTNYPDPSTIFHPSRALNRRLMLIQRAHQRKALLNLQYFNGVYVAILKKKSFGARCQTCFDQATKTVTLSNCPDCYGTGWDDGYYNPMLSNARIQEAPMQTRMEPSSEVEIVQANIELLDFPRLNKDDVIVERDTSRRWLVRSVTDRYLRRRSLTQQLTCTELSRTSSQYKVPVDFPALLENTYVS